MSKSAIIDNGTVVNVIEGALPGSIDCSDEVAIGWTYDGATFIAPPVPPLTDDELKAGINSERDSRINGGFIHGGKEYQTDAGSRENIAGAQGLSLGAMIVDPGGANGLRWSDPDVDFSWTAADNSEVPMTAAECQAFCLAAMQYKAALIKAARALKDQNPLPLDYDDDSHWPSRTLD